MVAFGLLMISFLLPWFTVSLSLSEVMSYSLYEKYTGIGFWVLLSCLLIGLLFLFSHQTKELIRPYILGGLKDGQIYMLLGLILLIELLDILSYSSLYEQYATASPISIEAGWIISLIAAGFLIGGGYAFFCTEQRLTRESFFLDRTHEGHDREMSRDDESRQNMSLPL